MRLGPAVLVSATCLVAACTSPDDVPVASLGCEPRRSWTEEEVARWASALLLRPDLPADQLGAVTVEYVGVPSPEGCITAATLAWEDRLDGGVVLTFPDGRTSVHGGYADARSPISAGPGRIGFVHTAMRGTSALESRFRMLCATTSAEWVDCLDVVTDQTMYPSWNPLSSDDRSRLRLAHRASIAIEGDSISIGGRRLYLEFNGREPTSVDLGALSLRLPALSR